MKMLKKYKLIFSICLSLLFLINNNEKVLASSSSSISVSTFNAFEEALKNDGIDEITISKDISFQGGQDEPLVIPRDIVIEGNNNAITMSKAGIILEGNVTIKNCSINVTNFARNLIVENGFELTLENVDTSSSTAKVDVFCGKITDTSSGTFKSGSHGKVNILGATIINNIYAGNFSDGKGANKSASSIPATIYLKTNQSNAVNEIYGVGGSEPSFGGNGNLINVSNSYYPVTNEVLIKIESTVSTIVKKIYAQTSDTTAASIKYKGGEYSRGFEIEKSGDFSVLGGHFQFKTGSSFIDDQINISIEKNSSLNLSLLGNLIVNDFTGNGALVLENNQSLTIMGKIKNKTSVYLDNINMPVAPIENVNYILANDSSLNFEFIRGNSYTGKMPTYKDGVWKIQEEDKKNVNVLKSFAIDSYNVTDNLTLVELVIKSEFAEESTSNSLEKIPFDMKINNEVVQKNASNDGYYTFYYKDMEIFVMGKSLVIQAKDGVDYLPQGTYSFDITVPSENVHNSVGNLGLATSFDLVLGTPSTPNIPENTPEIEIEIPKPNSNLFYTGMETVGVREGKGYSLKNNIGKAVGAYETTVSLKDGYIWVDGTKEDKVVKWEIKPGTIKINSLIIKEKIYDGTTKGEIVTTGFSSLWDYDLSKLTYEVNFENPNVGVDKKVKAKIKLNDSNYVLEEEEIDCKGTIKKFKFNSTFVPPSFNIKLGSTSVLNYDLNKIVNLVPFSLGNISFSYKNATLSDYYVESENPITIEGSKLNLPINDKILDTYSKKEKIVVTMHGENIEDYDFEIPIVIENVKPIEAVNPTGSPILNKTYVYYGEKLNSVNLSGTLKHDGVNVDGIFQWKNSDLVFDTVGNVQREWIFNPIDKERYNSVNGYANFTVKKAVPTGHASYVLLTGENKTLADAKLSKGTISIDGKIAWEYKDSTYVEAGKSYRWIFTPTYSDRYEELTGTVILLKEDTKLDNSGLVNSSNSKLDLSNLSSLSSKELSALGLSTGDGFTLKTKLSINSDKDYDYKVDVKQFKKSDISFELNKAGIKEPKDIVKVFSKYFNKVNKKITSENMILYDINLLAKGSNDSKWDKVLEKDYPNNGVVEVTLEIPAKTNLDDYKFYIFHMFDEATLGKNVGAIEFPKVEEIKKGDKEFIKFDLKGTSPVLLAWVEDNYNISESNNKNENSDNTSKMITSGLNKDNIDLNESVLENGTDDYFESSIEEENLQEDINNIVFWIGIGASVLVLAIGIGVLIYRHKNN